MVSPTFHLVRCHSGGGLLVLALRLACLHKGVQRRQRVISGGEFGAPVNILGLGNRGLLACSDDDQLVSANSSTFGPCWDPGEISVYCYSVYGSYVGHHPLIPLHAAGHASLHDRKPKGDTMILEYDTIEILVCCVVCAARLRA